MDATRHGSSAAAVDITFWVFAERNHPATQASYYLHPYLSALPAELGITADLYSPNLDWHGQLFGSSGAVMPSFEELVAGINGTWTLQLRRNRLSGSMMEHPGRARWMQGAARLQGDPLPANNGQRAPSASVATQ